MFLIHCGHVHVPVRGSRGRIDGQHILPAGLGAVDSHTVIGLVFRLDFLDALDVLLIDGGYDRLQSHAGGIIIPG